jgi:hypothetical protein
MSYRNTPAHHKAAEEAFKQGKSTLEVQVILRGAPHHRSPAQASACCRTARKHLGIYKSKKKEDAENAKRAKAEANKQSKKKTEVTDG